MKQVAYYREQETSIGRGAKLFLLRIVAIVLLLGSPGGVRDAMAVSLSATGTGETLLFPYYTTRNGYDTYLTLTNTTNSGKAIRINFREAYGGKAVLGFNAYLSANDQWLAAVVMNSSGGAKLITNDTSCTAPQIPIYGINLVNYAYANPPDAFAITSMDRTADGYVEVIEMGQIPFGSQLASNITPVNGVPRDCAWVNSQVFNNQNGGYPFILGGALGLNAPTGGLTGKVDLINVGVGIDYAYTAIAFNQFLAGARHTAALDDLNLDSAAPVSTISGHLTNWSRGADAVSAVLATRKLFGSFNLQAATNSATTLIAFSPTRPFYAGRAPFSVAEPGCEPAELSIFNSSGATMASIPAAPSLCRVGRVASAFGFGVDYGNDYILGTPWTMPVPMSTMGTDQGSFSLNLDSTAPITTATSSVNLGGLPVVGLVLQEFRNGNIGGVSSNYGSVLYAATDFNVFTFRTPVGSRENVDTLIRFAPGDIGKSGSIFITASVPSGTLSILNGTASSVLNVKVASTQKRAKATIATKSVAMVQVQLTPTGWQYVSNGSYIPFMSGVLGDLLAAHTILNNTDTASLAGAQFCLGYGSSAAEMAEAKRMTTVLILQGATVSDSCIISNTPISKASQTVSFSAAPTIVTGGTGTVLATATSGLAVVFTSITTGVCTTSGNTVTGVSAGTCTIAANQVGNASYSAATQVTQNITIGISRSDCIFNWAEKNYAQYFSPAGAPSATYTSYYYRYYSGTGNYLATSSADSNLYAIGTATGNRLLNVGPVTNLLGVSGCP